MSPTSTAEIARPDSDEGRRVETMLRRVRGRWQPRWVAPATSEPRADRAPAWSRSELLSLAAVLGVSTVLRLLVTRSVWLDEAITAQQASQTYPDMIRQLLSVDVHPPLYFSVLWSVVHLTGSTSELVIRLPSMLVGVALVLASYLAARDIWDVRTARCVGVFAAVAPALVWYSQDARMYMFWAFFAVLAAWAQVRILRQADAAESDAADAAEASDAATAAVASRKSGAESGSATGSAPVSAPARTSASTSARTSVSRRRTGGSGWAWAAFTLATVAMTYTQWFSLLPTLVQHSVFLAEVLRRRDRSFTLQWLRCLGASALLAAPLVPYLLVQAASIVTRGAQPDGVTVAAAGTPDIYSVVANGIWTIWGYHPDGLMVSLSALWPVTMLACMAFMGRGRSRTVILLSAIAVIPMMTLFLVGFERREVFELRYFTSVMPMAILLLGRLAATWARGPATRVLLPGAVAASLVLGLIGTRDNETNPRVYDFRGAVAWIDDNSRTGDLLVYSPTYLKDEMTYYPAAVPTQSSTSFLAAAIPPTVSGHHIYVLGSFLTDPGIWADTAGVLSTLERSGWEISKVQTQQNVTVWEYREKS